MATAGRRWGAAPFLLILTLLFLAASTSLFAAVFWPPVTMAWRARSWVPLRCTVEDTGVLEHKDSQGASRFSARVRYRYDIGGTTHVADRLSFLPARHADRARAEAEAARFPSGTNTPCFVDASEPGQAVLDRRIGRVAHWAAAPLGSVLLTVAVLVAFVLRRKRAACEPASGDRRD